MKLNEIDFNILSDQELVGLCLKYKWRCFVEDKMLNPNSWESLN